ncbi:MAG: TSUP family transporter [Candidatus Heimdallarchaeota archaeon]|nr:TSUP family transporter [Candidatus Heimdallarchaeota archaeon]
MAIVMFSFPIPWYLILALVVLVVLTTTLGAISGFSGSVFIVPLFSLILLNYDIPFITIVGCSASGCFFNGLFSTIVNIKRKENDWLLAFFFETPTTIGVFLGAMLTTRIDARITTSIFTFSALALAIALFVRIYRAKHDHININGSIPLTKNKNVSTYLTPKPKRKFKLSTSGLEHNDLYYFNGRKSVEKKYAKTNNQIKIKKSITPITSTQTNIILNRFRKEERSSNKRHKQKKPGSFIAHLADFGPKRKIERENYSYTVNIFMLLIIAFGIGFLAGMVGCGGGWVKTPVLISGFGVPPIIAVSTGMLMTTITLLISGIMHISLGHFVFWLWLIITSGSLVGSILGSNLKGKFSSMVLQIIMASTLTAIAVLLLTKTWIGF